ncbi:MAG TPA: glycine zipper 2TM domain-containing protein [Ramlibacter sp.]|jgi:osmotically inducible lipoprotein OsmB|uniref:glycine zipper 2TM domain-containing protein n=1 Tax=Ramlibacter sp. TaxID=1917967 RepID=UPI002D2BB5CA|nr:glycine zipper 2TM domain-containing protein [Ramlibacter sp.]HZY20720.1 glycine zipper 2TM domain-containing protein [Ramlibacter sp.]
MKTKLFAAIAAASLMGLTGCGTMDRQTAGTVGGAAVGGVLGNQVFGGTLGTLGGAAAGGYIGNRATDPERK